MMTSCVEESFNQPNAPVDADVNFTARVSKGPATRTVYGDIVGNMQNVYWVHGDKVSVFGAKCGISQAEYSVGTVKVDDTNTPILDDTGNETPVENQNYANYLTKTGSAGVQWGNVAQTDFYAVYPSTGNSFTANGVSESTSTATDGSSVNIVTTTSATVKTNISIEQKVKFLLADNAASGATKKMWKGVHYGDNVASPSAPSALMYACTPGAIATDENGNAKTVDLQFQPFSTILRFKFDGFHIIDVENTNAAYTSTVYVTEITLTAPSGVGVAGDFDLTIKKDKTASAGNGTSNVISIIPSVQIPLETDQALEFDVFAIPQDYRMSDKQIWSVTLKTTGGDHTYKMIPKIVNEGNETSTEVTLRAGKIHNLGIPTKTVKTIGVQVPDSEWVEYIPRNVYLSELSMPGAWYAVDANYQGSSASLTSLYEKGVRAFHIDCRVSYDTVTRKAGGIFSRPDHIYSTTKSLVCCGTESVEAPLGWLSELKYEQGETVKSKIEELISIIKQHPEEYIMVILTVAEKPCTINYGTGGDFVFSSIEPSEVLSYIKRMIDDLRDTNNPAYVKTSDNEEKTPIVYNNPITTNTTVNDVLGHIVIKINTNSKAESFTKYNNIPSTLISYASMASNSDYISGDIVGSNTISNLFTEMQTSDLYWGSNKIVNPDNMVYYYHQAQLTTSSTTAASTSTTPSLYDRAETINNIIEQSAQIYSSNNHNALFQLGVGGYVHHDSGIVSNYNSQAEVAAHLNTKILNAINEKLATEPSPIGVVLMNFAYYDSIKPSENGGSENDTDTYETNGLKLTKAILEMNKKFFLNRNPEAEEWPNGNPFEQTANPGAQQLSVAHVTVTEEAF